MSNPNFRSECDGNVLIFENYLSEGECEIFKDFFINFPYEKLQEHEFKFWMQRLINSATPQQPGMENCLDPINPFLERLRLKNIDSLNEYVGVDEWVSSPPNLIKMWPGSNPDPEYTVEMFVHKDNQDHMEKPIFWGLVYYPNDDYEGGEIFYPDYDFLYKPKANSIALHSGETFHGVKKVTKGDRFCVATLATKQNVWTETPLPTPYGTAGNEDVGWHYPRGYWGKRMKTDPLYPEDIKRERPDGTTAPYNDDPEETMRKRSENQSPKHNGRYTPSM
jgi:hypothetical protein